MTKPLGKHTAKHAPSKSTNKEAGESAALFTVTLSPDLLGKLKNHGRPYFDGGKMSLDEAITSIMNYHFDLMREVEKMGPKDSDKALGPWFDFVLELGSPDAIRLHRAKAQSPGTPAK